MKSIAFAASTVLLLTACATGPTVQILEVCPRIPALELNLPDGVLEHDFIGTMQQLLQGNLPLQPSYSLDYAPALQTAPRLNAN